MRDSPFEAVAVEEIVHSQEDKSSKKAKKHKKEKALVELDSPPTTEEVYISSRKRKIRDALEENKLGSPDIPAAAPSPEDHAVSLPDVKASLIEAN
jgi:hypothetical protein